MCTKTRDPLSASNPFSKLKTKIFSGSDRLATTFQNELTDIQKDFSSRFLSPESVAFKKGVTVVAMSTSAIPFIGATLGALNTMVGLLLTDGDWQSAILQMIVDMNDFHHLKDGVKAINRDLKNINAKFEFLNETSYKNHIYDMNEGLKSIIDAYADPESIFRKYPLISSPYLILVSLALAAFEPIAAQHMPRETKKAALSCQAYDLLKEFQAFAVDMRIDKLHLSWPERISIKTAADNEDFHMSYSDYNLYKHDSGGNCLGDDFGTIYCNKNHDALMKYGRYLKKQVEDAFPVDQLKQVCEKEWPKREPTGKFMQISFYIENGLFCFLSSLQVRAT